MKTVSTKLSNPEWEVLVDKCNEKGITLAEYVRELIKNDSADKKPVESVEVKKQSKSILSGSELKKLLEVLDKAEKQKKSVSTISEQKESIRLSEPRNNQSVQQLNSSDDCPFANMTCVSLKQQPKSFCTTLRNSSDNLNGY
jgi:hypothetical protein